MSRFIGEEIGRKDKNGVSILCGDEVRYRVEPVDIHNLRIKYERHIKIKIIYDDISCSFRGLVIDKDEDILSVGLYCSFDSLEVVRRYEKVNSN